MNLTRLEKFFIYSLLAGFMILSIGNLVEEYHYHQMQREFGDWLLKTMHDDDDDIAPAVVTTVEHK